MTEDEGRFLDKLETLYIDARDLMDGTASPIRRLIDEGDVVYGVWPDAIKPHGIDYGVLKGGELIEKGGRVVVLLRETLVPCRVGIKHFGFGRCFAVLILMERSNPPLRNNDGSLAMLAAIRHAALRVNNLVTDRRLTPSP